MCVFSVCMVGDGEKVELIELSSLQQCLVGDMPYFALHYKHVASTEPTALMGRWRTAGIGQGWGLGVGSGGR